MNPFLHVILAIASVFGLHNQHRIETVQNSSVPLNPSAALNTVNLTASYTFVLPAGKPAAKTCLQFVQPQIGGPFTVTAPANVLGYFEVRAGSGTPHSMHCFIYSPSQSAWVPTANFY